MLDVQTKGQRGRWTGEHSKSDSRTDELMSAITCIAVACGNGLNIHIEFSVYAVR